MAELKTKFSIGDVVYQASTTTTKKQHPCPDCLGTHKWSATSPAGGNYQFGCPRCGGGYQSGDELSLDYTQFVPITRKLTIGSVRVNTSDNRPVTYMCRETGVGTGNVYDEENLFLTEDEAMKAAEGIAAGSNVNIPWVAKRYNKTLALSDYNFENAMVQHLRSEKTRHSSKLQMLFEDLREARTMADVKEILEGFSLRDEAA